VPVLAGLLGVLAVVGLGIAAWLLVPSLLGENLEVPSLEGKEIAAAQQEVGDDFELVSSEQNSTKPKGTIVSQDPKPGAEAQQGEEISVAVSTGTAEVVTVPDVVGEPREEAEKTLGSEGFEVKVKTQESSGDDAGKVVGQSPSSGGEAEEGSEITLTVGEATPPGQASESEEASGPTPGYNLIQDPTGGLTVEVPPSWEADTGQESEYPSEVAGARNWSTFAGEEITSSITTAPSLDAWYNPDQPATGAYLVASRTLAQSYSDDDLIFYGLFSGLATNCEQGPYEDFNRSSLSGKVQTWYNCRGEGVTNFVVAAAPEGRECVVVLQAKFANEADREAIQHMIDTFAVNCGEIAGIDTEDQDVEFASSSADIPAT
jgi:hypothetical protein